MAIGAFVRRLFGPYEREISEAYRAIYVRIDAFVAQLQAWRPQAARILEIGCGEGAVTERLAAAYPSARITAIDISPRVGRLYAGPRDRVAFARLTVQEAAAAEPGAFDLVVLADVMHHVPQGLRAEIFAAARRALAPDGAFVFKDWERTGAPIHWLCHFSDRWLTGDRIVYMGRDEMRAHLAQNFGEAAIVEESRIAPWSNNLAFLVRP